MYVRELKNGKWQAIVKVRDQRRSVTRETKREVLRAGRQLEEEMLGPDPDERVWSSNPTVAAACEMQMRTGGYAPTLAAEYRRAVDRLPDELGRLRLGEVRVPDVEAAYRTLARAGVKPFAVRRIHELLRVTFAEAVRLGILPSSPIPSARPPAKPDRDVRPPTPAEVRAIIDAADPGPARIAFAVAAATGARRGELAALRWDDVDLDQARISIVRSLAYAPWAGVHERPTKTGRKGHRVVSIDHGLVDELRTWRARQCEVALAHQLGAPEWVVSDLAGVVPWRPDRITREFIATSRAAGVTGVRLHDMRHYVATQLLAAGVPPSRVAAMLGHTSTATTERIYRHWIPGEDADMAALLGRITRGR